MEKEENLSKLRYKLMLVILKFLPMLCALCYLLNIIFSYFDVDLVWIGYIAHVSLLPLFFIYITSIVFKFCNYHRMFTYYIGVNEVLNILDYNELLPITDRNLFLLHIILAGVTLFLVLYLYVKHHKKLTKQSD